jgi:phosphatidylinositol alpha-mannosyltransferase
VATFHTAMARSRLMETFESFLRITLERITSRIAVSASARKVQVEHLDGGAVEIPNGVTVERYATATPLDGWPGEGGAIGFLGRFTEPRKGFPVLRSAFVTLARERPGLRLLVAGPGDADELYGSVPADLRERVVFLGKVTEADKARMLRSVDVYAAPNIGGESFGMILTEAMAAGAAVVASDLEAFKRVLDGGRAGVLFPTGDASALAGALATLLDDPERRAELRACATEVVGRYDWPVVAKLVLEVYAAAIEATDGRVIDVEWDAPR